jgi:hypothetical protein
MQNYHVFVDEMDDTYQIALIPSSRNGGAMGTKHYLTKEAFTADLQRYLRYTDAAIGRFFSLPERDQTLAHYPLSDDAAYLGWLPEFNK